MPGFDVPVALIFFTRPDTLQKVFEQVRKVKPKELYLIQDGPRENNEQDKEKILECRKIVEQIDWDCEIHKNYSETNLGCGMRPYTGISWVFENVDRAIILEDDCVPAMSFFDYCKEMLERYENDFRVGIISGLNHFGEFDFGGFSYGFVKSAGIWGWATWKSRWEKYDYSAGNIDNDYIKKCLSYDITPTKAANNRIKAWINYREAIRKNPKVAYWDNQWSLIRHINSWCSIVPKYNQISNIGIGNASTHAKMQLSCMPKKVAGFFFMETKELEFPLKHPDFLIPDREYDKKYYKIIYPPAITGFISRCYRFLKKKLLNVLKKDN